jgi:hypothetical protein
MDVCVCVCVWGGIPSSAQHFAKILWQEIEGKQKKRNVQKKEKCQQWD